MYKDLFHRCELFYKLARKADDLAILKNNIGNYIHFSNSSRLGIHYSGGLHPGNPRAVYGFPLTPTSFKFVEGGREKFYEDSVAPAETDIRAWGTESKYIYIFNVNGNILNMDKLNLQELQLKIKTFVRANYPKGSYHTSYGRTGPTFLYWVGNIARDNFKNEHSGINILLRGIGYDAIETRRGGFGDDITSEIAVLNPSAINLIAIVNNPILSKEDIKDIDWYNGEAYKDNKIKRYKLEDEGKFDEANRLREEFEKTEPANIRKYKEEFRKRFNESIRLQKEKEEFNKSLKNQ
jgi:hypothetical protein